MQIAYTTQADGTLRRTKIVLVTGSRTFPEPQVVSAAIVAEAPDLVIAGGARGADTFAASACARLGVHCASVEALWKRHGKKAGSVRNQAMVDMARLFSAAGADVIVLAFMDLVAPTPGTSDCLRRADAAGLKTRVVEPS